MEWKISESSGTYIYLTTPLNFEKCSQKRQQPSCFLHHPDKQCVSHAPELAAIANSARPVSEEGRFANLSTSKPYPAEPAELNIFSTTSLLVPSGVTGVVGLKWCPSRLVTDCDDYAPEEFFPRVIKSNIPNGHPDTDDSLKRTPRQKPIYKSCVNDWYKCGFY